MKQVIILAIVTIFLGSCKTETGLRVKFSGPRKVAKYTFYEQDPSTGEFSKEIHNRTDLGTMIFFDNGSDTYNDLTPKLVAYPAAWGVGITGVGSTGKVIGWYADFAEGKSFSFYSVPDGADFVKRATYTAEFKGKTLVLTGVFMDIGGKLYKEVMELEEVKP